MTAQIDTGDPRYRNAAAEIIRRHDGFETEANITSAVRDFLTLTGLVSSAQIVEENPPAAGSRQAVDLTALDVFIEFKRRIGSTAAFEPNPEYVDQLDDYLAQSQSHGRVRMGILTDGRRWLLRWPNAGPPRVAPPYAFTLNEPNDWFNLYQWLRDHALSSQENRPPTRETIDESFGQSSPAYRRDIASLRALYDRYAGHQTIQVKRQLWENLLTAALGEVAATPERMDDLFVRHTYLTAVIGMVVQASFGIDINKLAETAPSDLLQGREFLNKTGLQGIVESDFFAWPTEVGGKAQLGALARRVSRFDWTQAPNDIAAILYETVIPPEERRQLGEYYTPDWLARGIVEELAPHPLGQYILDPACGSGTFVAEAVTHLLKSARANSLGPRETLEYLRVGVAGIDVHPVAVHLARAAWVLAAQPAIQAAVDAGFSANVTVPIYLGDALQLRFRTGDLFAQRQVTVQVDDGSNTELIFPMSLVERAEDFDSLMADLTGSIQDGDDPRQCLADNGITNPSELAMLEVTIGAMERLHSQGRDHIWAYYVRNLVRPVALAKSKVDVIVGNPPWINYNQTVSALRTELEGRSKNDYGIWQGGRYATHQDVAGLFFTRCVDLYLKDGGLIGMVMPHSALQAGQYAKWRTGSWARKSRGRGRNRSPGGTLSVDFGHKTAWDLEGLEPNTFFPVPASVVFARRVGRDGEGAALAGEVERWLGAAGSDTVRRTPVVITDTSAAAVSPYDGHSRLGAILYPRCLIFVEEVENQAIIQAGGTVTVNPRRGAQDKRPWRDLDLTALSDQTIETRHLFDVHLGETVVPYATLEPLKAVLPLDKTTYLLTTDDKGVGGIRMGGLARRMRGRWATISKLWEDNKSAVNKLNLLGQLDYWGHMSAQLNWGKNPGIRNIRVVYTKSGTPTAALLHDNGELIDHKLFWIGCRNLEEAHYLLAIINSDTLYESVSHLMPKGQFGARDLQKHLWKLPIPEYDSANSLHAELSDAGRCAAEGAAARLAALRVERSKVTVTIARRELRAWLRASPEGARVEAAVGALLGRG